MASRHRSRELAVQMAYQFEMDASSLADPKVLDRFWNEQALSDDDNRLYFEVLIRGVAQAIPFIDSKIEASSKNWKMTRLDKVDLAILRVAIFELLMMDEKDRPDAAVVINEAVEIAKKFGNSKSPLFVNGVLDSLITQRDPGRPSK
jgi:N utilization substance protein B